MLFRYKNLDIVKRLEKEFAHINVGIVSIVHPQTGARVHTEYSAFTVCTQTGTYFVNCVACEEEEAVVRGNEGNLQG